MKNIYFTLPKVALLAIALASASAYAEKKDGLEVSCSGSLATTGNAGYIACQGPTSGNISAGHTHVATFSGLDYKLVGTSDDVNFGPFSVSPGTGTTGTLTFDGVVKGLFVLGIKGGPDYSLYLFNGGAAGVHTLSFDTFGIETGHDRAGPGLGHLALFGPTPVSAVPEPESYALMLAGLGLVGAVVRRRKLPKGAVTPAL